MSASTVAGPAGAIAAPLSPTGAVLRALLRWGPVVTSVVLVVLFQIPFLSEPMERDEGFHFVMVTSGDLPYVNAFDNKPPITYFWYYLALWLNGGIASAFTVHVMVTVLLSMTAVAVYATGRVMRDHAFGAVAALVFSLFIANQYLQFNGNTESLALLPLTLSLLAFVLAGQRDNLRLFALAGVFGAIAALTRTSMAFNLAALVVFLLWTRRSETRTWADTLKPVVLMIVASALVGSIAFLPWLLGGHVSDFWQANVTATVSYSSQLDADGRFGFAFIYGMKLLQAGLWFWALALAGCFAVVIPGPYRRLLRLWLLASIFAIAWTGYFYPHYFIQLLPGAALCASAALFQLSARWSRLRTRLVTVPLLVLLAGITVWSLSGFYVADEPGEPLAKKWGDFYAAKNREQRVLAKRVRELSAPDEAIYVLGPDPQLYVLSQRQPAARVYSAQWFVDDSLVRETIRDLERRPPDLFIDDAFYVTKGKTLDVLSPELRALFSDFIAKHYRLLGTVNTGWQIAHFYGRNE